MAKSEKKRVTRRRHQRVAKECGGCGRVVSQPHAATCPRAPVKHAKNIEAR